MIDLEKAARIICDNIDVLINDLNLDLEIKNDSLIGRCPIHVGNNDHAFRLLLSNGLYKCFTKQCHQFFLPTTAGFIRGILSSQIEGWRSPGDPIYPFNKTINYITSLYDLENCRTSDDIEQKKWCRQINEIKKSIPVIKKYICTKEKYLEEILPSNYFIKRGFDPEVLKEFDVGSCIRSNKYFSGHSLVPTFDVDGGKVLGISGRSETNAEPRWKNSKDFPSSQTLYNIWKAREYIKKTKTAILTEGPADVWKIWQAGYNNVVGLYGGSFSSAKHFILDQLGVMNLVLVMDNDENKAGDKHAESIINQYGRLYNIHKIELPKEFKDVGEMPSLRIKELNLK